MLTVLVPVIHQQVDCDPLHGGGGGGGTSNRTTVLRVNPGKIRW